MVVRTESLRAQSARHRVDQPTISGRSCANSAHYKPLFACVDRTFVKSIASRRRPEKKERMAIGRSCASSIRRWLGAPAAEKKCGVVVAGSLLRCTSRREVDSGAILAYPCHQLLKQTWGNLGPLLTPMSNEGNSAHCDMASRANKRVVLKAVDSSHVLRDHVRQDQLSVTRCAVHCFHSRVVRPS